MNNFRLLLALLCGALLAITGTHAVEYEGNQGGKPAETKAKERVNLKCPVLTDQDIDPAISTIYQGKQIFFCCPKCKKAFIENPDKYLKNLPQFSAAAAESPAASPAGSAQGERKGFVAWLKFLGKFHVVVVHFPIALLLCAALAELIFMRTRKPLFSDSAYLMVILGALSGIVAVSLGWAATIDNDLAAGLLSTLEWHRWLGLASAALAVATAILSELGRRKIITSLSYRVLLFSTALVVSIAGYFGGILVNGADHFSWH